MSSRDECSSVRPCSPLAAYMSHFALPTMRLGAMAADVISCRKQLGLPVLASHFLLLPHAGAMLPILAKQLSSPLACLSRLPR